MRDSGIAIAGKEVENDEAAKDGGSLGRIVAKCLIEFGVDGARGGIAMPIQKFGVSTQSRGVMGRRRGGFFQAFQCLKGVALTFHLPDFAGSVLCGNPHSRYTKS